jgi:dipeptidyl aminopeptidase/acylaminoacyl peptidase
LLAGIVGGWGGELAAQRTAEPADLIRLREVTDPQLSPDGAWVAYTVTLSDTAEDKRDADVWMSSWNGKRSVRLTWTKQREHTPRWSPGTAGALRIFRITSIGHNS